MRSIPLVRTIIVACVALPMVAAAQRPAPAPTEPLPARPAPHAEPALPPELHELPIPVLPSPADMAHVAEEVRLRAEEMRLHAMELSHFDAQRVSELAETHAARIAESVHFDAQRIAEAARVDVERVQAVSELAAARVAEAMDHMPVAALAELTPPIEMLSARFQGGDRLLDARPRAPWASEDPADSLYRLGREALNRGEYRRAAQLFNEVTMKFKTSEYAQHSAYWEAFARYRLGTTEELKVALNILEGKGQSGIQLQSLSKERNVDVPTLRARILGALAARGDADAARQLESQAAPSGSCDREEVSVRAEALGALGQMDLAAAMPTVTRVLKNRDECTVELRRRALYLLGREPQEGRVALMLDVAKNDPNSGIRGEAMSWIARVADDDAVPLLQELLRTSDDERTQRSAVSALGSIDSDRARVAVRTIIERADAPERVRYDAIVGLTRTRNNREPTADDVAYLRGLYPKLESQRLRQGVLTALSRIETPETKQFFLAIVRNQGESIAVRTTAMQRLGRMSTVDELAQLYSLADARSLREQILSALYQRKEPESVDRIMEIARRDTDPAIRRHAITLIARKAPNDPKAQQFLQEFFEPK